MELTIDNSKLTLHNADCMDILKDIPDESIDLAVVDSPYGINFKNSHVSSKQEWDKFEDKEYIDFSSKWLNEIYRVLKPNGTCWSFFGRTKIKDWFAIVENTKFINQLENWITYARSKGRSSNRKLKSLAEEIWMLTKSDKYEWNSMEYLRDCSFAPYREKGGKPKGWAPGYDGKLPVRNTGVGNIIPIFTTLEDGGSCDKDRRGVVLDIGSGSRLPLTGDIYNLQFPTVPSVLNTMERQCHSAQKATLILIMLILLSSKKGDTVLDCFGGSFSTGAASIICNRNFIGIEQDKETFDKGVAYLQSFPFDKWSKYVKNHISTAEKGKFGFDSRIILPK
jgi:site-specific DNA-methyltransferase (adenine-specific)